MCAGVPYVTRSAPSRPSAVPERTMTPRSARPLTTSDSSAVSGRCSQQKFACDAATEMPSSRRPSSISTRATIARSTRSVTASWCLSASTAAACAGMLR